MTDHREGPRGLRNEVPLAPLTSLQLGGPARHLVEASDVATIIEALRWAAASDLPVAVLGGGTNSVVADAGFPGLVLRLALQGRERVWGGDEVLLTVAAGEELDQVVAETVTEGLAGLECLSGIPGSVGAGPIQNVGAYGQELSHSLYSVRVLDRQTLTVQTMPAGACGLGYRTSCFRQQPDRFVVLAATFCLQPGGAPALRYPELVRSLGAPERPPGLADVRQAVLELRRSKSMVLDAGDPNSRSAGSFFVNPVLTPAKLHTVCERAVALGVVGSPEEIPRFATDDGRSKVPAAWLIEAAGFAKGHRRGPVGLSARHVLALVHHGGGTTRQLLALAADIRGAVQERFGLVLSPEPVFLGFAADPLSSI